MQTVISWDDIGSGLKKYDVFDGLVIEDETSVTFENSAYNHIYNPESHKLRYFHIPESAKTFILGIQDDPGSYNDNGEFNILVEINFYFDGYNIEDSSDK